MMTLGWFPTLGSLGAFDAAAAWALDIRGLRDFDIEREENDDAFLFRIPAPGMRKRDLDVEVRDGVVTVRGRRTRGLVRLRTSGSLFRSFSLPPTADSAAVRADYKNGVLVVEAPKRPEARARRIPIRVRDEQPVGGATGERSHAAPGSGSAVAWAKVVAGARALFGLSARKEVLR